MSVVRFTAKRALAAGTSLNDLVTMELSLTVNGGLTYERQPSTTVRETISGKLEYIYFAVKESWTATTIPLRSIDSDKVLMFLASCEAGEVFLWSPYQNVGDTYVFVNAVVVPGPWAQNRGAHVDGSGNGQSDYFTYSVTIRKAL